MGNTIDVNEHENNLELSLFPNPTNGVINLKSKLNLKSWEITNNLGQSILNGIFANSKNSNVIDVNSIESGVYFLRILTENRTIIKKIIKQ